MTVNEALEQLVQAMKESSEYQAYARWKAEVEENAGMAALVKEYKRLQMCVQVAAFSGQSAPEDDMQRFQQLGSLLLADQRTQGYLLAEMQVQRTLGEVFQRLTNASGIEFPMPM